MARELQVGPNGALMRAKPRAITKKDQLRIWIEDGWYCQLSCAPIIFPPTLKLLDLMLPGHGYWDLRYRYSHAPLLAVLAGVVDHKVPRVRGGGNVRHNLQAACNAWNISKSNRVEFESRFSFWKGKSRCKEWDGLYSVFRLLYDSSRHGRNSYLASWHKAVERVEKGGSMSP